MLEIPQGAVWSGKASQRNESGAFNSILLGTRGRPGMGL